MSASLGWLIAWSFNEQSVKAEMKEDLVRVHKITFV